MDSKHEAVNFKTMGLWEGVSSHDWSTVSIFLLYIKHIFLPTFEARLHIFLLFHRKKNRKRWDDKKKVLTLYSISIFEPFRYHLSFSATQSRTVKDDSSLWWKPWNNSPQSLREQIKEILKKQYEQYGLYWILLSVFQTSKVAMIFFAKLYFGLLHDGISSIWGKWLCNDPSP